jgi:hypothetical protein
MARVFSPGHAGLNESVQNPPAVAFLAALPTTSHQGVLPMNKFLVALFSSLLLTSAVYADDAPKAEKPAKAAKAKKAEKCGKKDDAKAEGAKKCGGDAKAEGAKKCGAPKAEGAKKCGAK